MKPSVDITETLADAPPLKTSRATPAEDIRVGSYVAVLRATCDIPSFCWGAEVTVRPPEQPIRYQHIPFSSGTPMKVRAVCVPFVFAQRPCGRHVTLDLRRCEIATLATEYAEVAWKALRPAKRRSGKKRRKRRAKQN